MTSRARTLSVLVLVWLVLAAGVLWALLTEGVDPAVTTFASWCGGVVSLLLVQIGFRQFVPARVSVPR